MILPSPHEQRHQALYDDDGNIVIPPPVASDSRSTYKAVQQDDRIKQSEEFSSIDQGMEFVDSPSVSDKTENIAFATSTEESAVASIDQSPTYYSLPALPEEDNRVFDQERRQHLSDLLGAIRESTVIEANALLSEGARQYHFSIRSCGTGWRKITSDLRYGWRSLQSFLTQPVWIIRSQQEPKRYNRWTLFVLDTVRFGGTFTALFIALFIALNYQSFWEIVSAHLNPIAELSSVGGQQKTPIDALRNALLESPVLATSGADAGNLLSYLPPVGPPENRLIVPKLNLNVPIVSPSIDALLREDWTQVENDIQQSLQEGVVHYPGTANPGQAGNFFLTGHSSYYPWAPGKYKTVFSRLQELDIGDEYWVYFGGDKHRYIVTDKKEVKPSNVDVLTQPLDRRLSTLMTCTPVGTTLRRLIIASEEVDPATAKPLAIGEQPARERPDIKVEMLPI